MNKLSTQPYKGTRDFYPADMRVRQWMFGKLRQTLKSFGFEEYDGPMLEPFDLYASKTSEEIVNEQLYWMMDRGDRKLAVRPEMTPTLARMVAAKQMELPKPIRWFSIPNLWRYERPQRGRLREHWQLNVDVFGGGKFSEDLELCQVIDGIMRGFGATEKHFEVRINHRGILNYLFTDLLKAPKNQIQPLMQFYDGGLKLGAKKFRDVGYKKFPDYKKQIDFLDELLFPKEDAKSSELLEKLKAHQDYKHIENLLEKLKELGIEKSFKFDPKIARGFLYYTGMVVEVYDLHPENNRALFGGGRYDNLVGMFGGNPLSGVGFGMGDVTLRNFLETHKLLPNLNKAKGLFLAHLDDAQQIPAQKLAQNLRKTFEGEIPILTALKTEKLKKAFTTAEKLGARAIIFVGSDEIKTNNYSMKDLVTGKKYDGPIELLAKAFSQLD